MKEKPSESEIRSLVGDEDPDESPIETIDSFPSPEEQQSEGVIFKFIGVLDDAREVFTKTKLGKTIKVILIAKGLFMLASPIVTKTIDFSTDTYTQISAYIEEHKESSSKADEYLVLIPEEYKQTETPIHDTSFPTGSGIAPLSGDMNQWLNSQV